MAFFSPLFFFKMHQNLQKMFRLYFSRGEETILKGFETARFQVNLWDMWMTPDELLPPFDTDLVYTERGCFSEMIYKKKASWTEMERAEGCLLMVSAHWGSLNGS